MQNVKFNLLEEKSFKKTDVVFVVLIALGIVGLIAYEFILANFNILNDRFAFRFGLIGFVFFACGIYFIYKIQIAKDFVVLEDYVEIGMRDLVTIENNTKSVFDIFEIENLRITYSGIDDLFPSSLTFQRNQGRNNFIEFGFNGSFYRFEFYIKHKSQTQLLRKIFLFWDSKGIRYKLINHSGR